MVEHKYCPYKRCALTEIIDARDYPEAAKHFYRCNLALQELNGKIDKEINCPDHNCEYHSGKDIFDRIGK